MGTYSYNEMVTAGSRGFGPGVYWSFSSQTVGNRFNYVAWSPTLSLFVGVCNSGQVLTTSDPKSWTNAIDLSVLTSGNNLKSVCWVPSLGIFVAVGTSGTIITSSDGINWSLQVTPDTNDWNGVAWSSTLNLLVAVGGTEVITSSNAGVTWNTQVNSGTNLKSVCSSSTLGFVAVGDNIIYSADGTTWHVASTVDAGTYYSVAWSPTLAKLCAVGTGIVTSLNADVWTTQTVPTVDNSHQALGIVWADTQFAICGNSIGGTNIDAVLTSIDGINWSINKFYSDWFSNTTGYFAIGWSTDLQALVTNGSSNTIPTIILNSDINSLGPPDYIKGGQYFDININKMRIGGVTNWETVSSS